jgi:O-antigen/teichoic acid export membrane protein
MLYLKSVGIYAIANVGIGLAGIALTIMLARQLGSDGFGLLASLIALQNIWAALGFMRIETRIATSTNLIEADKILLAGFLTGAVVSAALVLGAGLLWGLINQYALVFVSGFALSILDALAMRHAFGARQHFVIGVRAARILGPLLLSVLATVWSSQPGDVYLLQSLGMLCISLAMWRRWIGLGRWRRLCGRVLQRHRRELFPSLVFCLLNGIWLNALTPLLNVYATSAQAGQFALLQRVLGGSLGLVSTATTMAFVGREHVNADLAQVRRIFLANLACSFGFCLLASIVFLGGWVKFFLGDGWAYQVDLFISVSLFLIFSYSVGAISVLASRLRDEWFLTLWQAVALLIWVALFILLPSGSNFLYALNMGAFLYVVLGLRWYFLLKRNDG